MLKRSTSLITALCVVLMLVSMVTLLEVQAAARMRSTSFTTSDGLLVEWVDLGYVQAPAGMEPALAPGYYRMQFIEMLDQTKAHVKLLTYSGELISEAILDRSSGTSYASSESMGMTLMQMTTTASPPSPSPSPSTPPPSTEPVPPPSSPSPSPSGTTRRITFGPDLLQIEFIKPDFQGTIRYENGKLTGTLTWITPPRSPKPSASPSPSPSPSPGSTVTPTR